MGPGCGREGHLRRHCWRSSRGQAGCRDRNSKMMDGEQRVRAEFERGAPTGRDRELWVGEWGGERKVAGVWGLGVKKWKTTRTKEELTLVCYKSFKGLENNLLAYEAWDGIG